MVSAEARNSGCVSVHGLISVRANQTPARPLGDKDTALGPQSTTRGQA